MILTNLNSVPGKRILQHYGLVSGSTVRAKHVGKDIWASFKNIVGGELKGYTELLQESRNEAVNRMVEQAEELGANAIECDRIEMISGTLQISSERSASCLTSPLTVNRIDPLAG